MQNTFFDSSLPDWLSDSLVNTLSNIRSAWKTTDGRWRQWEAYDCADIDNVHNDGERHIPYIMFWPETTYNKLKAWAKYQLPNGMIQEMLANGPNTKKGGRGYDDPDGRIMSDVTSMFLMYIWELYTWDGTQSGLPGGFNVIKEYWDNIVKGAMWQINVSTEYNLHR
eukprot:UN30241